MQDAAGTIVVGVDDSDSSAQALIWAAEQARLEHRELILVHTIEAIAPDYPGSVMAYPREVREELKVEGHQVLSKAAAEVAALDPDLVVHQLFRFADTRELLLELSETAAMIVIGSRGRGRLRSLLLGSVSVAVVKHAHCPVVVLRPGPRSSHRKGILVGADGSEESRAVLEFAYREASLHGLPLTVLHCYWDINAATAATYVLQEATLDLETERLLLAEAAGGIGDKYPEVQVTTEMATGMPQDALVKRGEEMDLIVVGAHRMGALARMLFGSVSISVVEHSVTPVAVVPVTTAE